MLQNLIVVRPSWKPYRESNQLEGISICVGGEGHLERRIRRHPKSPIGMFGRFEAGEDTVQIVQQEGQ
jgi:hypothetical protein